MTETILVPFDGEGSGIEDLTWGQIGLWQAMRGNGRSRTMGGVAPMPPGGTLAQAADALRFVMSRHQALRTRLVFDADGTAKQSCSTSGDVPLQVIDADGEDPAHVAEQVLLDFQDRNFDYEHEWPVRTAVIRAGGQLTHVVTVYLHLVIDADGLGVLMADLAARDPVTGEAAAPVTATPPLEQARQQHTPAVQRQGTASLRHLERVFRTMSPDRFGEPKYPADGFRQMKYHSPATLLAIRATATKQGVNTASVLLATFAVGLARFTGNSPVMAWLMVNNRFRPGFADSVSALVQISPFLIDVTDTSLGDTVIQARGGAMSAYKNAYYHPDLQDDLIDAINAERGVTVDYSCFYNDRRQGDRDPVGRRTPTEDEIIAAVERSEHEREDEPGLPRQKLYFHVDDPPGAIDFTMSVDTRYFSEDDMVTILRNMEDVAVTTALDPTAPTGVRSGVTAHA